MVFQEKIKLLFNIQIFILASTVSHDSHNLVVVYDTPENAVVAAQELVRVGGGQTAVGRLRSYLYFGIKSCWTNVN